MIFDQLENWKIYPFGKAWETAFDFLSKAGPDLEEKQYNLQGDDIYVIVQKFETHSPEEARIEAHRKHVDIQMVISGVEQMECFQTNKRHNNTEYDESKDIQFYDPAPKVPVTLNVSAGTFAVFFPNDAHMPQLNPGEKPITVKKAVVKIKKELLGIK